MQDPLKPKFSSNKFCKMEMFLIFFNDSIDPLKTEIFMND